MEVKTKEQILCMSKKELSAYIEQITQTPICKDKEYCDFIIKRYVTL